MLTNKDKEIGIYEAMKRIIAVQHPVVCAWCPGFDPAKNVPGQSHGICPSCQAKMEKEF